MKSIIIVMSLSLAMLSCKKHTQREEKEEIPASIKSLMDSTHCFCLPYIELREWRRAKVYFVYGRGATCNSIPRFYTISGQETYVLKEEFDDFLKNSKLLKHIWSCQ